MIVAIVGAAAFAAAAALVIGRLQDRIARLEARVARLETAPPPRAPRAVHSMRDEMARWGRS